MGYKYLQCHVGLQYTHGLSRNTTRHDKDPSCSKAVGAMQTLALTVQRPQPFVINDNVQIRVKYSQTDLKQYTINEWINLSTSLLYCTIYMFWSMGAQYLSISIRHFAKSYMNVKKNLHFLDTNTKHRATNSLTCFKLVWIVVAFFGNFMIQHGVFWSVKYILQAKSCTKSGSRYIII